jgi:exodeoxyribonuclease V alpha subunit
VLPDAGGQLHACFAAADDGVRRVAPARLPAHETAFATTVHKAQGSEFDEVLVLLPAGGSRVLTRELLYTAATRARARLTLAGPADAIEAAIATPTRRRSGLLARLREAAAETPPAQ